MKINKNDFEKVIDELWKKCVPCQSGEHQYKIECNECRQYPYQIAELCLLKWLDENDSK